jgi:hypothetical protein
MARERAAVNSSADAAATQRAAATTIASIVFITARMGRLVFPILAWSTNGFNLARSWSASSKSTRAAFEDARQAQEDAGGKA